jgi:carboxymethylenebutenolidase
MSSTQTPDGYLAVPASSNGNGVLVLHPWWGLNATIKAFCDRLADAGFVTFAPDLYHGKVVATIPEAEAAVKAMNGNHVQAEAEIVEAVAFLKQRSGSPNIALIGFSMGAYYALELSNSHPEGIKSVIVFYGTGAEDFSKSQAAYLGHFAGNDDYEPQESVDALEAALKQAGRPVTIYTYPGTGHWFFESDRDVYDATAANLAWERTLDFLKRSL